MESIPARPAMPVAPYLGGKRNLARLVIGRIAAISHTTYAEPFVGMGGDPTVGFPTFVNRTLTTVSTMPPHDTVILITGGSYLNFSSTQSSNEYSPFVAELDLTKQ